MVFIYTSNWEKDDPLSVNDLPRSMKMCNDHVPLAFFEARNKDRYFHSRIPISLKHCERLNKNNFYFEKSFSVVETISSY